MGEAARQSRLVFSIGLTGHRDVCSDAGPAVRESLRAELEALKSLFRSLPVELVTGLAEGADTIATEIALEIGLPVRAVLPMPRELYETDFEGEALESFRRLADDSRVVLEELPLPYGTAADDYAGEASRDVLYARLMDYLVRRSNVLVALWDGEFTGLTGGTSDVVVRFLGGENAASAVCRPLETIDAAELAEAQSDLVIWIKAPRRSRQTGTAEVETAYLVQAGAAGLMCRLPRIPGSIIGRWTEFDEYIRERDSYVGADVVAYPIAVPEDASVAGIAPAINADFVRADQLAIANQTNSDRLFKLFGLMAALMGLTFLLYAKIAALKLFLVVYVAVFAAGYVLFSISARRGWFGRHLAFRAFAEVLRIRFFLVLSGSGRAVDARRLIRLAGMERFARYGWIRDAIRCTEPLNYESEVPTAERVASTADRWVNDQAAYFRKKHHQLHTRHERLERIKQALFLAAFIGAVSLLLFKGVLYDFHIGHLDGKTLVVFLMGLLPLWLAVWEIYETKMATRELQWQYANQGALFELARRRLAAASDSTVAQNIIAELAGRALMDVVEWTAHRYHREHEPPAAG